MATVNCSVAGRVLMVVDGRRLPQQSESPILGRAAVEEFSSVLTVTRTE